MNEPLSPKRFPLVVVASILLTALLSSYSIWKRHEVKEQNRSVAIAADYESVRRSPERREWGWTAPLTTSPRKA